MRPFGTHTETTRTVAIYEGEELIATALGAVPSSMRTARGSRPALP